MDVRLIHDTSDLTRQLQAIQSGKGGGTNFKEPLILGSPPATQDIPELQADSVTPAPTTTKPWDTPDTGKQEIKIDKKPWDEKIEQKTIVEKKPWDEAVNTKKQEEAETESKPWDTV